MTSLRAVRFLWASYKAPLGGVLGALAIGTAIVVAFESFGMVHETVGRITSFGFSEGKTGSRAVVVVKVDGRIVSVPVPPNTSCEIGSVIELRRRQGVLAPQYKVALERDPCH